MALTVAQVKARTKFVTRRMGWINLKVGDRLMACEKCQGLGKGGKIVKLGELVVINVRREPLYFIHREPNGCSLEGFPEWEGDPQMFIDFYCDANKCSADDLVTRIQFDYVEVK